MSTPTLRPWREDEVPLGCKIRNKIFKYRAIITAIDGCDIHIGNGKQATVQILFANFTRDDGSPCGTTEP